MKPLYLNGIGLVSRAGNTPDALREALTAPDDPPAAALAYDSFFEKAELRRINRYAKLAAEVSARCLEDAGIRARTVPGDTTGILFTTGYGAAESNVKFFKSVQNKEPDFCNPLTFASMVPNYALGTVCILLRLHGYSTTLLGGNPFDIAMPVLRNGTAEQLIIGAQEEYCPEVFAAVEAVRTAHTVQLAEGSVAFCLSAASTPDSYAELLDSRSYALPASPLLHDVPAFPDISFAFPETPDLIFGIGGQVPFGQLEQEAFAGKLPGVPYTGIARTVCGETLGSSFLLNLAVAAVCLKTGTAPVTAAMQHVLVTGTDVQGNYMQVLLKKGVTA